MCSTTPLFAQASAALSLVFFSAAAVLSGAVLPPAVHAEPVTIGTSSIESAFGRTSQRKTFFDSINNRYWVFYHDGTAVKAAWSSDLSIWTGGPSLAHNTSSFSVTYHAIGLAAYAYIAVAESNDIIIYRAQLSPSGVVFSSAAIVFDGVAGGDSFSRPTTAVDGEGYVWVAAVKDIKTEDPDHLVAAARRSAAPAAVSDWGAAHYVGRAGRDLQETILLPLQGPAMYLLANSASGSLLGYRYQNGSWRDAMTSNDYAWFGFPGRLDGTVRALLLHNGVLYAGGSFSGGIARWNGSEWSPMSSGVSGTVHALSQFQDRIYAGGDFSAGSARNLAYWDGDSWQPAGSGPAATVNALAVAKGDLFVGGSFSSAGGAANTSGIARWNGFAWSSVGGGLNPGASIYALASLNDYLYAGGSFESIGGNAGARHAARWDTASSAWQEMSGGLPGDVLAFAVSGTDVYVGGSFSAAGGAPGNGVVRWNEAADSWHGVGGGLNGPVRALFHTGAILYAGGEFENAGGDPQGDFIAWYNGGDWSGIWSADGSTFNNAVYALSLTPSGMLAAGGLFLDQGGELQPGAIASFDGSDWQPLGGGFNSYVLAIAALGSDVYVGGSFTDAFGLGEGDYIVRWDGSTWHAVGGGLNSSVAALAVHDGRLYAGGFFTDAGGNAAADRIAVWEPAAGTWSALGPEGSVSEPVTVVAAGASGVYIGGELTAVGGNPLANNIARWDGSAWHSLGSGLNTRVYALALIGSTLYAGGSFTDAGGIPQADRIASFDGTAWSALGPGATDTVYDFAVSGTNLYAVGLFTNLAGISPADYIARWDGSAWHSLGGLDGPAFTVAAAGSRIYAGGVFSFAGGAPAERTAFYDGSSWSSLGIALNSHPEELAAFGSSLLLGGNFTSSTDGQFASFHLAQYSSVVAADVDAGTNISASSDEQGNVHLLYTGSSGILFYRQYNGASGQWSTPITICADPVESFAIGVNRPAGRIYATWIADGTVQQKQASSPYGAGQWDGTAAVIYSGSSNRSLSSAEADANGRLLLFWSTGSNTPYSIVNDNIDLRYALSGTILVNASPLASAAVSGGPLGSAVTSSGGRFSFTVPHGTAYSLSYTKAGYSFTPAASSGTVTGNTYLDIQAKPAASSPVYAMWNSFLGMVNIVEIQNIGDSGLSATVTLYDIEGDALDQIVVPVNSQGQYDLILNDMNFPASSYGIVRIDFSHQQFDGRVFYYRPAGGGDYDFAFALPFNNPSIGTTYAAFNTLQPSFNPVESANLVEQWLALVNLDPSNARSFTVRQYSHAGDHLRTREVALDPFSRVDINGGHDLLVSSRVGLNEIIPSNPSAPYLAALFRYGSDTPPDIAPTRYRFAFPLLALPGSTEQIYAPLSRGADASNWLELVNCSGEAAAVRIGFYDHTGAEVRGENINLYPHAQEHINAADFLPAGETGLARITPGAGQAIIAQSMFYFRNTDGSIAAMYGSQARQSYGTQLVGSYNLFLGMVNWLKMINLRGEETNVRLDLHHPGGSATSLTLALPPYGGIDRGLHEAYLYGTAPNTYGVVSITAAHPGSVYSELLRIKPAAAGGVDFAAPTPVR